MKGAFRSLSLTMISAMVLLLAGSVELGFWQSLWNNEVKITDTQNLRINGLTLSAVPSVPPVLVEEPRAVEPERLVLQPLPPANPFVVTPTRLVITEQGASATFDRDDPRMPSTATTVRPIFSEFVAQAMVGGEGADTIPVYVEEDPSWLIDDAGRMNVTVELVRKEHFDLRLPPGRHVLNIGDGDRPKLDGVPIGDAFEIVPSFELYLNGQKGGGLVTAFHTFANGKLEIAELDARDICGFGSYCFACRFPTSCMDCCP